MVGVRGEHAKQRVIRYLGGKNESENDAAKTSTKWIRSSRRHNRFSRPDYVSRLLRSVAITTSREQQEKNTHMVGLTNIGISSQFFLM